MVRTTALLVALLLSPALAGCVGSEVSPGAGEQAPRITFSVEVRDAVSGAGVEGAQVLATLALLGPCGPQLAWQQWRPTDLGDGRFELTVPAPSGDGVVVAFHGNATGYAPGRAIVGREDATSPRVEVALTLRPLGTLRVPEGPPVGLHDLSGEAPPRVLSAGEHELPAGRYAWGRGGAHGEVDVSPGGNATLPEEREAPASGMLDGVVRVGGHPRPGALVLLGPGAGAREALPGVTAAAVTDDEGRFSLAGPQGNATLVAWVPGESPGAGSLAATPVTPASREVAVEAEAPRC